MRLPKGTTMRRKHIMIQHFKITSTRKLCAAISATHAKLTKALLFNSMPPKQMDPCSTMGDTSKVLDCHRVPNRSHTPEARPQVTTIMNTTTFTITS